jgi:anti-sigma factor RsiW
MSHVDEGTLHALVDDALPAAERAIVEAHLAVCGDCARHFAEASAMAHQVHTLLGALDEARPPLRIAPVGTAAPVRAGAVTAVPASAVSRRMRTLRRVALAASVLVVAGISYRVGVQQTVAPAATDAVASTAVKRRARAVLPSVVEVAPEAIALPSAPSVRVSPRGGPRAEQDLAAAGSAGAAPPSAQRIAAPALAAVPPVAPREERVALQASPMAAADRAADAVASEAVQQVSPAAAQQAAQQASPTASQQAAAPMAPRRATADVAESMRRAAPIGSGVVQARGAEQKASEASNLAATSGVLTGYTSVEEVTVPTVTRRRYVAADGTTLVLLIAPSTADGAKPTTAKGPAEFTVSTVKGRSTVRWQVGGRSYELQGALTPDSLVKLATQLR